RQSMSTRFAEDVGDIRWVLSDRLRQRFADSEAFREWLSAGDVQIVKHGPHRTVYRVTGPDLDVHLKQDRPLGLRGSIRSWLRPLKARREYELTRACQTRGVSTPNPLAWGASEPRGSSWLITETLPDALPLVAVLEKSATTDFEARQLVAELLGAFV